MVPMGLSHSLRQHAFSALATTLGSQLVTVPAAATVYHVAQATGADSNPGTEAAPFATITACAQIATAGDVCRVHSGTYRETISPANSGTPGQTIRFEVADGECATVTGTEPLSASFTKDQGNIWLAPAPDTIEQLFSNGVMVWEGQWPNRTPGVLFESPKGIAAQGSGVQKDTGVTYLVDPNIPAGDWVGALVYIMPGSRWQSDSRPVKAYDPSTHTITLDTTVPWAEASTQPVPSNQYFLYGSLLTLDMQDEWVWQSGALRYYSSSDPSGRGLEYKKRSYAFDVHQSYIELVGFHVFGSAVRLTGNHNLVDSLTIEYSSHLRSFNAYFTDGDVNHISGSDNTWNNSLVSKSGSAGLMVEGNRNLVQNNVFEDVVYQATNHGGIGINDSSQHFDGNQFLYNTVERSGRSGIFLMGQQNSRALFNKVSDYALLTNDMGGIYAWGTDGLGGEIAYNEVFNSDAFWGNGIYLDDKTKHFVVHHNYVHDSTFFGFCIKEENYFFNNTLSNVGTPFIIDKDFQKGTWTNTNLAQVKNNATEATFLVRVGVLPSVVTDYGYFEAEVHPSPDWQHFNIAFASLYQPGWFVQAPLDLTSVAQISFTPWANGEYEFDLDNVRLEGQSPLLLDDFESAGGSNALGGSTWASGSGDGTQSTSVNLTFADGGASSNSKSYAVISGAMFQGWDSAANISWGQMEEVLPNSNLSSYTGVSFDMRGRLKTFQVLAIEGNAPVQDHNASCTFSGSAIPACAVDTGVNIPGVTDGYTGSAPDIGAFETGVAPFAAGAVRNADASTCGKVADLNVELPKRVSTPWTPVSPDMDAGVDAGITEPPDAGTGPGSVTGGGCRCNLATAAGLSRRTTTAAGLVAILLLSAKRRRRDSGGRARNWALPHVGK